MTYYNHLKKKNLHLKHASRMHNIYKSTGQLLCMTLKCKAYIYFKIENVNDLSKCNLASMLVVLGFLLLVLLMSWNSPSHGKDEL